MLFIGLLLGLIISGLLFYISWNMIITNTNLRKKIFSDIEKCSTEIHKNNKLLQKVSYELNKARKHKNIKQIS